MAEKSGAIAKMVAWQKEHISDRQMTLILAFVIGLLASVAGFFLHSIVHEIQILLTSGFEKSTYNLLFLLFPIVASILPRSLSSMWCETISLMVSRECSMRFLPSSRN